MPWFLASPGYQQPCYWLFRIHIYVFPKKEFQTPAHLNVKKWWKMQIYFCVSLKKTFNSIQWWNKMKYQLPQLVKSPITRPLHVYPSFIEKTRYPSIPQPHFQSIPQPHYQSAGKPPYPRQPLFPWKENINHIPQCKKYTTTNNIVLIIVRIMESWHLNSPANQLFVE